MKFNWKRVLRTLIQSAAGAGIALLTAITTDFSKAAVTAAVIQFGTTVAIAVLMNIQKQTEGDGNE
jgi:hypothetical protein|nr:MAG TPA: hypothetical protein [Caudoviricetes sp.]